MSTVACVCVYVLYVYRLRSSDGADDDDAVETVI